MRRKLAEIRAQKIGKRPGRIDTFIPAGKGRTLRAFHDRWAHDGDRQIAAVAREDGLAKTLRESVGIRPAEMLCPAQADAHKPVAGPACAIALQHAVELSGGRGSFIAAASQRLAAKSPLEFPPLGAFLPPTHPP